MKGDHFEGKNCSQNVVFPSRGDILCTAATKQKKKSSLRIAYIWKKSIKIVISSFEGDCGVFVNMSDFFLDI